MPKPNYLHTMDPSWLPKQTIFAPRISQLPNKTIFAPWTSELPNQTIFTSRTSQQQKQTIFLNVDGGYINKCYYTIFCSGLFIYFFNVFLPLFKKLRDIIFLGGTITLRAISRDILRGPRLFWPLNCPSKWLIKLLSRKKNYDPQFLKKRYINITFF